MKLAGDPNPFEKIARRSDESGLQQLSKQPADRSVGPSSIGSHGFVLAFRINGKLFCCVEQEVQSGGCRAFCRLSPRTESSRELARESWLASGAGRAGVVSSARAEARWLTCDKPLRVGHRESCDRHPDDRREADRERPATCRRAVLLPRSDRHFARQSWNRAGER